MKDMLLAGLKRFGKGFVAGGVAQMLLIIGAGLHFSTLKEVGAQLTVLLFAFLTGGLLAVEKMLNYSTTSTPQ